MKKICIFMVVLLLAFSMSNVSGAEAIEIKANIFLNSETDSMEVKGSFIGISGENVATMKISDENGVTLFTKEFHINQVDFVQNISEISKILPNSGMYTLGISLVTGTTFSSAFSYVTATETATVLAKLNDATLENMNTVFEEDMAKKYSCFNISDESYAYYNKYQMNGDNIREYIYIYKPYYSIIDVKNKFLEAIVLSKLETASSYSEIEQILYENKEMLGLDLSRYSQFNQNSKSVVLKYISGKKYCSTEEVKKTFNLIVSDVEKENIGSSGCGGAGAGGGVSSSRVEYNNGIIKTFFLPIVATSGTYMVSFAVYYPDSKKLINVNTQSMELVPEESNSISVDTLNIKLESYLTKVFIWDSNLKPMKKTQEYVFKMNQNPIITVDSDNIVDLTGDVFEYYENSDDYASKKIYISYDCKVFVNDILLNNFSYDVFPDINNRKIVFSDLNYDGLYEKAEIEKVSTMIAGDIDYVNMTISPYVANCAINTYEEVLILKDKTHKIIDTLGNELTFTDLQKYDVLSIKQSQNSVEIIVSREKVTGTVEKIKIGNTENINNCIFYINNIPYEPVDGSNSMFLNGRYELFLNDEGKIARHCIKQEGIYGIVIATEFQEVEREMQLQLMTKEGIKTVQIYDKIYINDKLWGVDNFLFEALKNGMLIDYKFNEGDRFAHINFENNHRYENTFVNVETPLKYNEDMQSFGEYKINDKTVIFVGDNELEVTKDNIAAVSRTIFQNDTFYKFKMIYNEYNEITAMLMFGFHKEGYYGSSPFVITEYACSAESGKALDAITGYQNFEKKTLLISNELKDNRLFIGSVVQYTLNVNGEINDYRTLVENYWDSTGLAVVDNGNYGGDAPFSNIVETDASVVGFENEELTGYPYDKRKINGFSAIGKPVDYANQTLTFETNKSFLIPSDTKCYIMNLKNRKVKLGDMSNLQFNADDYFYIYAYGGEIKLALIFDCQANN